MDEGLRARSKSNSTDTVFEAEPRFEAFVRLNPVNTNGSFCLTSNPRVGGYRVISSKLLYLEHLDVAKWVVCKVET